MNNTQIPIESLLRSLKQDGAAIPSANFRKNARIRILNSVHEVRINQKPVQRPVFAFAWRFSVLTVLIVAWTLYAAQSSFPNSPLYPVKVLGERIALSLAPTSSIKTTIATGIVDRRIDEIQHAQDEGDQSTISNAVTNYDRDVTKILNMNNISRTSIEHTISERQTILKKVNTHNSENDEKKNEDSQQKDNEKEAPTPTPVSGLRTSPEPTLSSVFPGTEQSPDVKGESTKNLRDN